MDWNRNNLWLVWQIVEEWSSWGHTKVSDIVANIWKMLICHYEKSGIFGRYKKNCTILEYNGESFLSKERAKSCELSCIPCDVVALTMSAKWIRGNMIHKIEPKFLMFTKYRERERRKETQWRILHLFLYWPKSKLFKSKWINFI